MNKPAYQYDWHSGYWRVYKMTYIGTSSYGTEVEYYHTKQEARDKTYELNGWKKKTNQGA